MKRGLVFLVLCVLLFSGLFVKVRAASEADAQSAVNEASQRFVSCYDAVVNASKAGANVSALLQVLNEASGLLSRAELALENGDLNSSYSLAMQSQQMLVGFESRAAGEQNSASQANFVSFMVNIVGSLAGTVAVLGGSFAVWTWMKKRAGKVVK